MDIKELPLEHLDVEAFILQQIEEIRGTVGNGTAVNALSGGVDSSVVTLLAHRALGNRLKSYFIDSGLMRRDEPRQIAAWFKELGISVQIIDAQDDFFDALAGLTDPEEKREAITQTFYKQVFGRIVRESGAPFLFQGTNYTDVEETVAKIKRQHNVLEQLGIDPQKHFGYRIIE
ncbi:MAG: ExsB family transcriptional regulator, partial [Deltaproteobacteria bacterium]|nr:ExsB family transcriptional regulator [Deltaproteobacteria bacterium]